MFVDKAKENIKIQLTNMKRATECGLATKGEFNEDIDAIETILSELETVEQKEKFYKKLSEDNKYYVLELEKKNKQIVYMANFINDNTPYTRDTKELENEQGIRTAKFTQEYFFKKVEDKMEDFNTYAVLRPDGEWIEPGEMGWWGVSYATPEEEERFMENYKKDIIDTANKDWTLTIVDCHI